MNGPKPGRPRRSSGSVRDGGVGGPPRAAEAVHFLPEVNLFVRRDGSWSNGWQHWTILSPGPWLKASFTVKTEEEVIGRALATAAGFTPRFERRPLVL